MNNNNKRPPEVGDLIIWRNLNAIYVIVEIFDSYELRDGTIVQRLQKINLLNGSSWTYAFYYTNDAYSLIGKIWYI